MLRYQTISSIPPSTLPQTTINRQSPRHACKTINLAPLNWPRAAQHPSGIRQKLPHTRAPVISPTLSRYSLIKKHDLPLALNEKETSNSGSAPHTCTYGTHCMHAQEKNQPEAAWSVPASRSTGSPMCYVAAALVERWNPISPRSGEFMSALQQQQQHDDRVSVEELQ